MIKKDFNLLYNIFINNIFVLSFNREIYSSESEIKIRKLCYLNNITFKVINKNFFIKFLRILGYNATRNLCGCCFFFSVNIDNTLSLLKNYVSEGVFSCCSLYISGIEHKLDKKMFVFSRSDLFKVIYHLLLGGYVLFLSLIYSLYERRKNI